MIEVKRGDQKISESGSRITGYQVIRRLLIVDL
jgi:hypothetical protein